MMAALAAAQPALRLPQMADRSPVTASKGAGGAAGPLLPARCRVARPVCLAGTAIGSVSAISGERSRCSAMYRIVQVVAAAGAMAAVLPLVSPSSWASLPAAAFSSPNALPRYAANVC